MNYLKKIFSTGAVRKTPHSVISKIVSLIKTGKKLSVVELGAGKGEITRAVINKIGTPRSYLAFEIDVNYCARLSAEFAQINVIEKDAFLFQEDTQQQDLIISSIPLSFYGAAK
ncbi:MAG: rRNA adenine N-6-methyltransferase family protein, partial [Chitinophagaceae bacterium]